MPKKDVAVEETKAPRMEPYKREHADRRILHDWPAMLEDDTDYIEDENAPV